MHLSADVADELDMLMNEVGLPTLDKVYSDIFDMNTKANSRSRAIAIRAFQWMMCAQRPLQIVELAEAVSAGQAGIERKEINEELILKPCSNFIIADASKIAQFTHLSVREYLEKRQINGKMECSQEQAHKLVAETCLTCLMDPPTPIGDIEDFQHGLLSYSVLFWAIHWENASENRGSSSLGKLFAKFSAKDQAGSPLMDWIEILPQAADSLLWSYRTVQERLQDSISSSSTAFFAACAWGFTEVLCNSSEISKPELINLSHKGNSSLAVACKYGQVDAVQLLVENGASITIEAFKCAVISEHEVIVRRLLENGAKVNETDIFGQTMLALAIKSGNHAIAQLLLRNGADIAARMNYYSNGLGAGSGVQEHATVLHIAAHKGNTAMTELLLDYHADIQTRLRWGYGETALDWALKYRHEDVARLLIEKETGLRGAAALCKAWQGVLYQAAKYGDMVAVLRLLKKGVDINAKDEQGRTALYAIGPDGSREVAQLLLDNGANVKIKDNCGRTPLHQTSSSSIGEAVALLLLEYGADIDAKDDQKRTILHEAAKDRCKTLVQLLIKNGADVEAKDINGKTPLHEAARVGNDDIVRQLLQSGANNAAEDIDGLTALHYAAECGSGKVVILLLEQVSINPNPRSKDGYTPLSLAVKEEHGSVVQALLKKGGVDWDLKGQNGYLWDAIKLDDGEEVVQLLLENGEAGIHEENPYSDDGGTLLHMVTSKGYTTSMRLLLERGADTEAKNFKGDTPLHTAVQLWAPAFRKSEEIICLLLDNGAETEAKNNEGATALHLAVEDGDFRLSIVQLLLKRGADINARDDHGATPLIRTICWKWDKLEKIINFLLEKGADVHIRTNDGSTVLHLAGRVAYENELARIVLLLLKCGADKTLKDKDGEIALDRCPSWSSAEDVKSLLSLPPLSG